MGESIAVCTRSALVGPVGAYLLKPATDLLHSSHSKCCKPAALTVLNGCFRPKAEVQDRPLSEGAYGDPHKNP